MPSVSYPRSVLLKLLADYRCEPVTDYKEPDFDYFIKDEVTIIRVPKTAKIDWDIVEMIATEQLEISDWEFDYWLGENGIV